MKPSVQIERPRAEELVQLFVAVGWEAARVDDLATSVSAYPCTICARSAEGELVGYLSAFSDEVMSTMLGELVVSPRWRRRGVGASMLAALEQRYPNAPIYIKALGASKHFYEAVGFRVPKGEFTVVFKFPDKA